MFLTRPASPGARSALRAAAACVLATAALTSGAAGPAGAEPRPTAGPFHDAEGRTNGCTGGADLVRRTFTVSFTCPASAGVRRENTRMALHQVQPDGSWRTIHRSALVTSASYGSTPLDGPSGSSAQWPCTPEMRGTHTYVARTVVTVTTSADDPNPYYGKYKDRGRITC